VKGLHKRGTNIMCTSHKKMWDVNYVFCMGQRHGSVLQISASPKLYKHLLMHRNMKLKEHGNITVTSLSVIVNKRTVETLIV